MKIPSCDSTIFTKGVCLAGQVGMFLGGASRGDDCFFFGGGNFPRLFTFRCILYKNTCDIHIQVNT